MEMEQDPNETGGRESKGELHGQRGQARLLLFYLPLYPQGSTWRNAQKSMERKMIE